MGNSPPTRKLASLPFVVIRFGSARIWSNVCDCKAWMRAPRLRSGRKAKMFKAFVMLNVLVPPPPIWAGVAPANCPVPVVPMVLVAPVETKLTPN